MAEETAITVAVVENPAVIAAEGEAEASRVAAEAAQTAAHTLETQVRANAAEEIAEYVSDVEILEEQVSWLNTQIALMQRQLQETVTQISLALAPVIAEMEALKASLTPPAPLVEEVVIAPELVDPASAEGQPVVKTPAKPKRQVRLI